MKENDRCYRWAVTPNGVSVLLSATQTVGGQFLCKVHDPDGPFPHEYTTLIAEFNIFESRAAAKRKLFKDKLQGFTKAK